MDSKSIRKTERKKGGYLASARLESKKMSPLEKGYGCRKTNNKILPPVKPRYLPPMENSSHTNGPAMAHQYVKQASPDMGHSEVARDYLSPQLIRNFPAESFAFLEQLCQRQRITVKKILRMKYITNLELLQKCKNITDWVTIASRDVVLPAVYSYQAITNDLYKRYTHKELHHNWLCLGDGWVSSAVNHEGVVSAANIFNALICMTRTNRKEPEDTNEDCLNYSGQSTPCNVPLASHRKGNLLFCSHIRVNASELVQHIYQMLLHSRLGSIYLSQSWWTMMTPDMAAKRNLEFLSHLLFNFIVHAVKNLLESFLGLPHKVPCQGSMDWTLQSRPGVSSTISSEEEEALEALSEVLISRVADVLSGMSITTQSTGNVTGKGLNSEDSAVTTKTANQDIYDEQPNGTGGSAVRALCAQSVEHNTGLFMQCKDEKGLAYQHCISPVLEGRDCDKNTAVDEQRSQSEFCLDLNAASGNPVNGTHSCTSVFVAPPSGTSTEYNHSLAGTVELIGGTDDSFQLKECCGTPELLNLARPSICWAYSELPGKTYSSNNLSQSQNTSTGNSHGVSNQQYTLSSAIDASAANVVEKTVGGGPLSN